jgi:hypothetical protein
MTRDQAAELLTMAVLHYPIVTLRSVCKWPWIWNMRSFSMEGSFVLYVLNINLVVIKWGGIVTFSPKVLFRHSLWWDFGWECATTAFTGRDSNCAPTVYKLRARSEERSDDVVNTVCWVSLRFALCRCTWAQGSEWIGVTTQEFTIKRWCVNQLSPKPPVCVCSSLVVGWFGTQTQWRRISGQRIANLI